MGNMHLSHPIPGAADRPALTEAALCAWIGQAAPGDRIAYHRGFLAWDLSLEMHTGTRAARVELAQIASRARRLADAGVAHLVQRREGERDYTYLILVRPRPRQPSIEARRQVLNAETAFTDASAAKPPAGMRRAA